MLDKILGGKKLVQKALDAAWTRNEAISQNIANVDTPGYKRKTVSFEEQLKQAMEGKGFKKGDVDRIDIKVTEDTKPLSMRLDGNNVDIDAEMAELAKNTIKYNTLAQHAGYSKIKSIIREGR